MKEEIWITIMIGLTVIVCVWVWYIWGNLTWFKEWVEECSKRLKEFK